MLPIRGCRSGYQAQVSLFMAPTTYDLADYLSWPDTDTIGGQQLAWARIKIYPTIDYTWGSLYSSLNATSKGFGANGRLSQVSGHFGGRRGSRGGCAAMAGRLWSRCSLQAAPPLGSCITRARSG